MLLELTCTLAEHCPHVACAASSHPGSDAKLAGGSVTPNTKGKDSPPGLEDQDRHMFDTFMDELHGDSTGDQAL
jgi:hypothetical protein